MVILRSQLRIITVQRKHVPSMMFSESNWAQNTHLYVIYVPAVSLFRVIFTICPIFSPKYLAIGSVTNIRGSWSPQQTWETFEYQKLEGFESENQITICKYHTDITISRSRNETQKISCVHSNALHTMHDIQSTALCGKSKVATFFWYVRNYHRRTCLHCQNNWRISP